MDMHDKTAAGSGTRRLYAFNAGFWTKPRIRRILDLSGWRLSVGIPTGKDRTIAIWGNSPTAWRGRRMARYRGADLVTVEDAFLRSVLPGRAKGAVAGRGPIGLLIDPIGVHFDPNQPSLIEETIKAGSDHATLTRARMGIDRMKCGDLSKYNHHDQRLTPPSPGYVLLVDQTRGDASLMGAQRQTFLKMLDAARAEHPGKTILVKTHPETTAGLRQGHLQSTDLRSGEIFCDTPVSPWVLLNNAVAIYAVSSQLGYEAILAGHRPRLFGLPFFAGWGLSDDEQTLLADRRGQSTPENLFSASHLVAPTWYDPCLDRLTDFEGALGQIEAETRTFRQDRNGHIAYGIRLWKRRFIAKEFGDSKPVRFVGKPSENVTLCWANRSTEVPAAARIEDGFLRSRGLGAQLTPPLSLVADDRGIYYDPNRESQLERLIEAGPPPGGKKRALALIDAIISAQLTKYNLTGTAYRFPSPDRHPVILVPGQVEDDASIRLGTEKVSTNIDLLMQARRHNPEGFLIYKPHPDVEAGLRPGRVSPQQLTGIVDHVASNCSAADLLGKVDQVWTMTSTLGFEALMRKIPVTVLGAPFYAGWGLTRDLGPIPERRRSRPDLETLVHACLIAYPRYRDPVSGLPCTPETIINRLTDQSTRSQGAGLRILAKLQGALAGHSWIWRR
ncbi:capsular polysaccharide biosynthesis protein [Paracoccus sp. Z330]|uniref:Capsular polysaccharide biosynthesis protein n=1 Tax=Paracoccus onchidii TaxID=3017813 RepID=A0ABT4ZGZ3_9RHOB|nr:capsular polysaccharide biosynthesis protein [Paracoccus onchidii]MDB6178534.1 capsular polysaccharide biosynthesis protein [Paracoccus onchidii]